MKSEVFVTGATGFVGRHVVSKLINYGHKVTSVVRNKQKAYKINQLKHSNMIEFDIGSQKETTFISKEHSLIHCAWDNVRESNNTVHLEKHFNDHFKFLKQIIDKGVRKIIITGSCYEYGLQYGPVDIHSHTKPNTPYALSKDMLHKSLRMILNDKDIELIWCRLFYNYGEGQDANSIIGLFDQAIERGDEFFNMSSGEQLLDYLPIDEAADQIISLLKFKSGIYNICSGKPISLRSLLENRMREKKKFIKLNLGYYPQRKQDSLAIWGKESFFTNLKKVID